MRLFSIIFLSLSIQSPNFSHAQSLIERKAIEAEPCKGFKSGVVGIDRLRALKIHEVSLSITGDQMVVSSGGLLECKTSDSAFIKEWAGADFQLLSTVDLATCSVGQTDFNLSNFRGGAGRALAPFIEGQEPELEKAVKNTMVQQCEALKD